jgi:hypothetical protein
MSCQILGICANVRWRGWSRGVTSCRKTPEIPDSFKLARHLQSTWHPADERRNDQIKGVIAMFVTFRDRFVSAFGALVVGLTFAGAAVLPAHMATAATLGF